MSENYSVTEQAIKAERFLRKYKLILIFIIILIAIFVAYDKINNYLTESHAEQASQLYFKAISGDESAAAELKTSNANLYAAYALKTGKNLETDLKSGQIDALLADLHALKDGKNKLFLQDLATLERAYTALKNNDIKQAHSLANSITDSSAFYSLARGILHYKAEQ